MKRISRVIVDVSAEHCDHLGCFFATLRLCGNLCAKRFAVLREFRVKAPTLWFPQSRKVAKKKRATRSGFYFASFCVFRGQLLSLRK